MMALLLACTPEPGSAGGTLTDARSGAPVAGAEVVLSAATCPEQRVHTDDAGRWSATGLCGQEKWSVDVSGDWELPPVDAGNDLALRAWPAPTADGIYLLEGGTLLPILTHTALDQLTSTSGVPVRFPVEIPGTLPHLDADTVLLVAGDLLPDPVTLVPLQPCASRVSLRNGDRDIAMDPWLYLGRDCGDGFSGEERSVPARTTGPTEGRRLRYLGADAAAPGRYALPTRDGLRAFLLDVG
jgi:hypothetical protein